MARNRMIKPDFWADEKIGKLTPMARLLFLGTINFCDDVGVCRGTAGFLRSQIFQYDDVSIKQVESMVLELVKNSLILTNKINGESFLFVKNFFRHQKIDRPSTFRFIEGTNKHNVLELFNSSSTDVGTRCGLDDQYKEKEKEKEKENENVGTKRTRQKTAMFELIDEFKFVDEAFHPVIRRMSEIQQKKIIEAYTLPIATEYIKKIGGWPKYNTVKDVYMTVESWTSKDGIKNQVEWRKQQDLYNKKLEEREMQNVKS